jgi:hypothetical protein
MRSGELAIEDHVPNVRLLPKNMSNVLHLVLDVNDRRSCQGNDQTLDIANAVRYPHVGSRCVYSALGELGPRESRSMNVLLVSQFSPQRPVYGSCRHKRHIAAEFSTRKSREQDLGPIRRKKLTFFRVVTLFRFIDGVAYREHRIVPLAIGCLSGTTMRAMLNTAPFGILA